MYNLILMVQLVKTTVPVLVQSGMDNLSHKPNIVRQIERKQGIMPCNVQVKRQLLVWQAKAGAEHRRYFT